MTTIYELDFYFNKAKHKQNPKSSKLTLVVNSRAHPILVLPACEHMGSCPSHPPLVQVATCDKLLSSRLSVDKIKNLITSKDKL